jgi:hypothetical protein
MLQNKIKRNITWAFSEFEKLEKDGGKVWNL